MISQNLSKRLLDITLDKYVSAKANKQKSFSDKIPVPSFQTSPNFNFDSLIAIVICLVTLIAYFSLHTNYNIYYEDDSWTMSNAWNLVNLGIDHDLIFLDQEGAYTGQLFGKLYFLISGNILNLIGWTKGNVYLINSAFIFLTAFVWYKILEALPMALGKMTKLLPLVIPIFPPCFFAAHTGRTDAFTLLILSIGFLMFVKEHYVLAGVLSVMAIESHIMGVVTLFYYLSYFLYSQRIFPKLTPSQKLCYSSAPSLLLKSAGGFFIGLIIYAGLHYQVFDLEQISEIVSNKKDMVSPVNNYILAYFTDYDWYYHLPEFGLLATTLFIYKKNKLYRDNPFLFILIVVLFISTIITRRENRNYIIYLVPAILMLYFYTYSAIDKVRPFLISLLLICSTYYTALYAANKDFNFDDFISFVQDTTTKEDIPLVGMPDVWFAAMERPFYPIHNERDFNKIDLEEFYLVETDYLSSRSQVYDQVKNNIYKNYNCSNLSEWNTYSSNKSVVCLCSRNNKQKVALEYRPYPGWQKVMQEFMPASIF